MPELPEVELHRRHLDIWMTGRTLVRVTLGARAKLRLGLTTQVLNRVAHQVPVTGVVRRGKHLFITRPDGGALYAHLGMTGHFSRRTSPQQAEPRFLAWTFHMEDGCCVDFTDPRRFGGLAWLGAGMLDPRSPVHDLGPDLLTQAPTPEELVASFARVKTPLKVALMDQAHWAGLGNIHAAEALWRARVSPFQPARSLTLKQARALLQGIQQTFELVLNDDDGKGVAYVEVAGNPNPFLIYDREGEPCPRCKTPITRHAQGGRSTYVCASCQPVLE